MKNFIIIKTENQGYFITDNIEGKSYFNSEIPKLKFDDKLLVKSFRDPWYKLSEIPKTVSLQESPQYVNKRWELKAGYPVSNLTPQTINFQSMDEDDEIRGLYSYTHDIIEGNWIDVEFEYDLIDSNHFFEGKPKYQYTNNLIDQLCTNPLLLLEKPCSITGKELYRIARSYIKTNLNGKYAKITSDYDFCFTVQKVIELAEPKPYKVDIGTKRRPNLITRYNQTKQVIVFESSPEGYSNYPIQQGLSASNYEELEKKIEQYLQNTMLEINKPLVECPHCKGIGVTLTNEMVK